MRTDGMMNTTEPSKNSTGPHTSRMMVTACSSLSDENLFFFECECCRIASRQKVYFWA